MFVTQCSAILGSSSAAAQLSQKEIHIAVLLYQFYVYRRAAAHNYHRERYIGIVLWKSMQCNIFTQCSSINYKGEQQRQGTIIIERDI